MNNNKLTQGDLELIERIIYKNGDDIAVSIGRSFERLEERIDAAESRIYSRLSEVEDKIEASRQDMSDEIGDVKESLSNAHKEIGGIHQEIEPLREAVTA
jgi:archaellum component FlaC